jgi:hypothetical protein
VSHPISNFSDVQNWFNLGVETEFIAQNLSSTRADFNGRLSSYEGVLRQSLADDCLYLFISSIGEVGNNCFDHNLGFWQNKPGCLFLRDPKYCVVADRGQGIKSSIEKIVKLNGRNSIEYVYNHIVSGRAPEKRGNGLKHVRRSLASCAISLSVYSGNEFFSLGGNGVKNLNLSNPGVFSLFTWK